MIPVSTVLLLLALHLVGDFFLQTDWMAINKSKSYAALGLHVMIYSSLFLVWGFYYAVSIFIYHFITDAVTSRVSAYFWKTDQRHWFFCVIGFDQYLHFIQLLLVWRFFYGT